MAKKTARALELNGGCCSPMESSPNDCVLLIFSNFVDVGCLLWAPVMFCIFLCFFSLFICVLFVCVLCCFVFFGWLACLFLFVGFYWFVDWLVSVFLGLFLSWFVGCLVICAVRMSYFDSRGGISKFPRIENGSIIPSASQHLIVNDWSRSLAWN